MRQTFVILSCCVVLQARVAIAVGCPPDIFEPGSTVLFQGDSITDGMHGGDMNHVYGHGFACEIASRYQALRPELRLQFANRGKSGNTSSNLVARWSTDAFPYVIAENGYEGALGRKKGDSVVPDYLSVLIGINDYFYARRKMPEAVSAEDYELNLRRLIVASTNANPAVRIVLCEPFRIPTDASPDFSRRQDVVAKLSAEFGCVFVPFQKLFSEDLLRRQANPRYWFWDFFHPTPAGHYAMADFWMETVAKAFAAKVRNTALEPRAKLEDDSYDWYARHESIVNGQAKADPEIVFIGDSITHGWEANDDLRGDARGCFAKWFGAYRTLNMGFGWDRIQNVLWRLSHGEMDGTKPRVVVIHIGTNNTAPGYKRPFPANTAEEIADGIAAVCRRVREKAPQAKIVLMDVFPRGAKDSSWRAAVAQVNAALGDRVRKFGDTNIVRVNLWNEYVGVDGNIPKDLMFDSLHPTAKGYDIWGAALKPIVETACRRETGDSRPYEFKDASRNEDEIAPWVDFEDETGWRAEPYGQACAELSSEQMLFGKHTLKVTYGSGSEVRIRPPAPMALPSQHDWFGVWIRNAEFNRDKKAPDIDMVFRLANGRETRLPLRSYYGSSKLSWPDWWYVVRKFSSQELKSIADTSFDGFAIRPCSNAVPCSVYFDNLAFFTRDESRSLEVAHVPDVAIPTRPEGALPDSKREGSTNATVCEGDVMRFTYTGPDGRLEYVWSGSVDTLTASWNGGPAFRPAATGGARVFPGRLVCKPRIVGKTLVIEMHAPAGETAISLGHVEGAKVMSRSLVPTLGDGYWWDENRSKVSAVSDGMSRFFVLAFPDWYVSAASAVVGHKQADGTYDRVCEYRARTDGSYNAVAERLYVTVSPELMETLPVIANPPSPWKHVTGTKAWCRYSASTNRAEDLAFLTRLHRFGIRDLVINEHECCMRDDGESFTFRDKSAPRKGGDKAWRAYADHVINKLGFRYGPYNNFTDLAPVNANWRFDNVCRKSPLPDGPDAGGLVPAWVRCYAPKAAFAYDSCVRYAPALKRKFGFNTAYCDVHTAILPWEYVDCDWRVPEGGKFQPFYRAYAAILLEQKKAWNGPVYSEGTSQFFYAGLADGNYGQLGIQTDKDPWIVDFDLLRIHPLECDFGVGNPGMFMPGLTGDSTAPELVGAIDRFLAATLAFGHTPFLVLDMMFNPRSDLGNGYPKSGRKATPELGLPFVLRSYHMVLPAAKRYSFASASEIRYLSDGGSWLTASEALFAGDREMQRIAVRYSDGTCVVSNGHKTKRIRAVFAGRDLDIPPCGYAVWNASCGLDVEASDRHGGRTDYSASDEAIYLDTRMSESDVSFPKARGRGLSVCRREGKGWEIIPVRGNVSFRIPGETVVAYDEAGERLGAAMYVRSPDGFISVRPYDGAFSFRVDP